MSRKMKSVLFDIEATGLLRRQSKMHCLVLRDLDEPDAVSVYDDRPGKPILAGVEELKQADILVGHNISGYDIPSAQGDLPRLQGQWTGAGHPGAVTHLLPQACADGEGLQDPACRDADPHVRIPFASRLGLQAQVLQGRVRQATRELQGLYP